MYAAWAMQVQTPIPFAEAENALIADPVLNCRSELGDFVNQLNTNHPSSKLQMAYNINKTKL